jgi:uncharacterized ParB-like nuclease family protein
MKDHIKNKVRTVAIDKLLAHPANPNKMSNANLKKLQRNIRESGRYEPLVVRPSRRDGYYQIINGHHRIRALKRLGYDKVDVVVWDVDEKQTNLLLATLNRLTNFKMPDTLTPNERLFAKPLVFFLDDNQEQIITKALSLAADNLPKAKTTAAAGKAAALTDIAQTYIELADTS